MSSNPFLFRISFLAFVFVNSPVQAEQISLGAIRARVLAGNPDLAAARWKIAEAKGRLLGAGRLANPEVEVERKPNIRSRGSEFALSAGFVQRFPLTNRLSLEKAVSRAQLAASEAELRDAERKLVGEARLLSVKWLAVEQRRGILARQEKLADELAKYAENNAAKAEGSSLEASQARLEAKHRGLEIAKLTSEQTAMAGELKSLLGLAAPETLRLVGDLSISQPERKSSASRPDIQEAEHQAEATAQAMALARAKRWDDLSVGFSAEHERAEDAPGGLKRDNFIGLKLSLPIPFWNKNEGEIAEKTAAHRRALSEVLARRAKADAEAETASDEAKQLASVISEIDGSLLPAARENVATTEAAYQQAQTSLAEVLRARERFLEIELNRLEATRDLALAKIRHETATAQ